MPNFYARNIVWGALEADNTVTVTFSIFDDEEVLVSENVTVTGAISAIQQVIQDTVRTKSEAVNLYDEITQNTEFAVEMAA